LPEWAGRVGGFGGWIMIGSECMALLEGVS